MPTSAEWQAIEAVGVWLLCLLPLGLITRFAPKLWELGKASPRKRMQMS